MIDRGEAVIGHSVKNLYVMIDGKEFTFPKMIKEKD